MTTPTVHAAKLNLVCVDSSCDPSNCTLTLKIPERMVEKFEKYVNEKDSGTDDLVQWINFIEEKLVNMPINHVLYVYLLSYAEIMCLFLYRRLI